LQPVSTAHTATATINLIRICFAFPDAGPVTDIIFSSE
jgi:hypothetical protein